MASFFILSVIYQLGAPLRFNFFLDFLGFSGKFGKKKMVPLCEIQDPPLIMLLFPNVVDYHFISLFSFLFPFSNCWFFSLGVMQICPIKSYAITMGWFYWSCMKCHAEVLAPARIVMGGKYTASSTKKKRKKKEEKSRKGNILVQLYLAIFLAIFFFPSKNRLSQVRIAHWNGYPYFKRLPFLCATR